MHRTSDSRKPLSRGLGGLDVDASPTRRTLMSQLSALAMGAMLSGAFAGTASARQPGRKPSTGGTVEDLPDGLRILWEESQIEVRQIADNQIGLTVAPADEPESPLYVSSHSGQLAQASAAPLFVVIAALAMAPSASSQTMTLSGPAPPAGPARVGAVRAKISQSTLNSSSAVLRCRATDHGLF